MFLNRLLSAWKVFLVPDNLLNLLFGGEVDVLFVLPDANRPLRVENKFFSPHIDPIYRELSKHRCCLFIARPLTGIQSSDFFQTTLTFNWLSILLRDSIWNLVLGRFKPKMVVGIDIPKPLIILAKEQNISVVELHHGFECGATDTIYFSKYSNKENSNEWPTEIIVYDDQSYKTFSEKLPNTITPLLARNYWFDFLETVGQQHLSSVRSSLEVKLVKYNKVALVSLQHGYDGSRDHLAGILENGFIHCSVIRQINKRRDLLFILKPHPVQVRSPKWKNIWKFLKTLEEKNDNVIFERVIDVDIFSLLALSDIHITMSSSAIYEAGILGKPSIGLCPTLQKGGLMQDSFKGVEKKGLLKRAKLESSDLEDFLDTPSRFQGPDKQENRPIFKGKSAAHKLNELFAKCS